MRNRNISIAEVGSVQVPVLVFPSAKSGIGLAATLNFPQRLPAAAAPAVKKRGRGQRQRPIPLLVPAHHPLDYPSSKSQCFNSSFFKIKLFSYTSRPHFTTKIHLGKKVVGLHRREVQRTPLRERAASRLTRQLDLASSSPQLSSSRRNSTLSCKHIICNL